MSADHLPSATRIFLTDEPGKSGYLIALPHVLLSCEDVRLEHPAPGVWEAVQTLHGQRVAASGNNIQTALLGLIARRLGYQAWFTPLEED